MIHNTKYSGLYKDLALRLPRKSTDRITDLNNLLNINSSFCIYSHRRNGMTTLLKEFTKVKDGIYIDCGGLYEKPIIENLESRLKQDISPIILDEAVILFKRLDNEEKTMKYLVDLSKKRQIGLRFHYRDKQYEKNLKQNNFEIIKLKNIPYEEFKAFFDKKFSKGNFPMPLKFLQYAYNNFDILGSSVMYVAEAFKLIVENPEREISELEVEESVKKSHSGMFR